MSLYNSFRRTLRQHPYAWIHIIPQGCSPRDVARVEECRKHGSQRTEQEKQDVAFDLRLFRQDLKELFAEEVTCKKCLGSKTSNSFARIPCKKHRRKRMSLVPGLGGM